AKTGSRIDAIPASRGRALRKHQPRSGGCADVGLPHAGCGSSPPAQLTLPLSFKQRAHHSPLLSRRCPPTLPDGPAPSPAAVARSVMAMISSGATRVFLKRHSTPSTTSPLPLALPALVAASTG